MKLTWKKVIWIIENWFSILTKENSGYFVIEPFRLRAYQRRVLREIWERPDKNILVEKTRQMGLSWMMAAIYAILILFGKNEQLLVLGKKEEFVDNSATDPNTLMGKIKFILENIRDPDLKIYVEKSIESKYLFISNRYLRNSCHGESSGPSAGKGSTYSWVWWDEAAFTANDRAIFGGVSPNSKRLILISTPNGKDNVFYRLKRDMDEKKLPGWHKIRVHWNEFYSREWYQEQCQKLGGDPSVIASELDIDYEGSVSGKIFYNFTEANYTTAAVWDWNLAGSTVLSFDFGISDQLTGIVTQYRWDHENRRPEFRVVDSFELKNIPFKLVFDAMWNKNDPFRQMEIQARTQPEYYATFERFMAGHRSHGYLSYNVTGDPAAAARSLETGKGIADLFEQYGIHYWIYPVGDKEEAILSTIRGWQPGIFVNSELAEVRAMVNGWVYEANREGEPVRIGHNRYSHLGDALKYAFNFYINNLFGGLEYIHNRD